MATGVTEVDTIPPLVDGDRLDRVEFRRRYEAMPPGVRAELIFGRVVMASPTSGGFHARPHGALLAWLTDYAHETPGVEVGIDESIELDSENEPQPDAALFVLPECGGRAVIGADGWTAGAPELAVEVSYSSARFDLTTKRDLYEQFGALEYLVWRVRDNTFHWFTRGPDGFEPIPPDADDRLRSRVFPGLWLHPAALIARDLRAIRAGIDAGCRTPEHAAFAATLVARRTQGGQP